MNRAASSRRNAEESLDPTEREALLELVEDLGERESSQFLTVSRQTLGRAIAGLPLQRGTIILIRSRLARPWGYP